MNIKPLKLEGTFEINFKRVADERGFFMRLYDQQIFADHNLQTCWEQESVSFNRKKDTLRGLHFQMPPHTETKLVRVVRGAILDVFVDLRKNSNTFGKWDVAELSAENARAVYIPKGFAHGFRTLTDNTLIEYKIDAPYQAELADGILWNDRDLNIDWNIENPIISERDRNLRVFKDFLSPF